MTPTAEFVRNPNWQLPGSDLQRDIRETTQTCDFVGATELATALMGDAIATNMFMLGYAYQKGWIPLAGESLERAIELNAVAVEFNKKSFLWGRRAAADQEKVRRIATPADVIPIDQHFSRSLDEVIERRARFLADYQNAAYADRYKSLVTRVRAIEQDKTGSSKLAEAVARHYHKLLAYKDEYEVARLHADDEFGRKIAGMFEGNYRTYYYLAPPLFAKTDPLTGEPRKIRFGGWVLPVFKVLKKFKFLRGTALDPFGHTEERRMERELIGEYEQTVELLLASLNPQNQAAAVQIASLPDEIRGFGHVKKRSVEAARKKRQELLQRFSARGGERAAA